MSCDPLLRWGNAIFCWLQRRAAGPLLSPKRIIWLLSPVIPLPASGCSGNYPKIPACLSKIRRKQLIAAAALKLKSP